MGTLKKHLKGYQQVVRKKSQKYQNIPIHDFMIFKFEFREFQKIFEDEHDLWCPKIVLK